MMSQCLLVMSALMSVSSSIQLIDLSFKYGPETLVFDDSPHFNRSDIFSGKILPGVYLRYGQYSTGEHGGTHMDAPATVIKDGKTIDDITLEETIAMGVQIDCSEEAARNRSFLVPVQKILDWEAAYGQIPMEAAVIFNFGWSSKINNRTLYLGNESDDYFTYVFPAVSREVAEWLYTNRRIKIVGTDAYAVDPFSINGEMITSIPVHEFLLSNNILIVEILNGTEQLPPTGFMFHAAPVQYVGNTAAQVRAYAVVYESSRSRKTGPQAVSREVAEWLYTNRRIKIVGTDAYAVDPFSINGEMITSIPVHEFLLSNNILIVEILNGTEQLPPTGFMFHAAPVQYVGNTAAQVRAYAVVYESSRSRKTGPQGTGY